MESHEGACGATSETEAEVMGGAAGADVEARRACTASDMNDACGRSRPVERELRAASGRDGLDIYAVSV
jgi:hypothetical protein